MFSIFHWPSSIRRAVHPGLLILLPALLWLPGCEKEKFDSGDKGSNVNQTTETKIGEVVLSFDSPKDSFHSAQRSLLNRKEEEFVKFLTDELQARLIAAEIFLIQRRINARAPEKALEFQKLLLKFGFKDYMDNKNARAIKDSLTTDVEKKSELYHRILNWKVANFRGTNRYPAKLILIKDSEYLYDDIKGDRALIYPLRPRTNRKTNLEMKKVDGKWLFVENQAEPF